jgi:hypothetical protein
MRAPKVSTKSPRLKAVAGGEVPIQKIGQLRGKGMNAGGSPNDLKKLFPKGSRFAPKFSKGGKVSKRDRGCK